MPLMSIYDLGRAGIIRDVPGHVLPPEAWTGGKNVRMQDGLVYRVRGEAEVFGTPSVAPHFAMGVATPDTYHILYMGLEKAFVALSGSAHIDVTRTSGGDYTGNEDNIWNGTLLGGIPVLTNGVDVPQFWAPAETAQVLRNLTAWPSGYTARYIQTFGAFLVAGYITQGGDILGHRVLWSHPAEPGALPVSWNVADATRLAGHVDLADTESGEIAAMLPLQNSLIIYKDRSTWRMDLVGGQLVMRFERVFGDLGCMGPRCVTAIPTTGFHVVYTGADMVTHNGVEVQSIVDKRWRRFLQQNMDQAFYRRCLMVAHPTAGEIWFCYPEKGAQLPSQALIWNYKDDVFGVRDLQNPRHITAAFVTNVPAGDSWDDAVGSWDEDTEVWGLTRFVPQELGLLQCDSEAPALVQLDVGADFRGQPYLSYVERTGHALVGRDRQNTPRAENPKRKLVKRTWLRGQGAPVEMCWGVQETLSGAIGWDTPQAHVFGATQYIDTTVNGRLLALKVAGDSPQGVWALEAYDVELEVVGDH